MTTNYETLSVGANLDEFFSPDEINSQLDGIAEATLIHEHETAAFSEIIEAIDLAVPHELKEELQTVTMCKGNNGVYDGMYVTKK